MPDFQDITELSKSEKDIALGYYHVRTIVKIIKRQTKMDFFQKQFNQTSESFVNNPAELLACVLVKTVFRSVWSRKLPVDSYIVAANMGKLKRNEIVADYNFDELFQQGRAVRYRISLNKRKVKKKGMNFQSKMENSILSVN